MTNSQEKRKKMVKARGSRSMHKPALFTDINFPDTLLHVDRYCATICYTYLTNIPFHLMELCEVEKEILIIHQKREVSTSNMAALIPLIQFTKGAFDTA